jgi:hypothetical protein
MIEFLLGAGAGVIIGYVVLRILVHIALSRAERELELLARAVEIYEASTIPARVEHIDGVFYVYDTRDDSFLAQGQTVSELRSRIEARVKHARILVTEGEESVLSLLKADLESGRA